MLHFSEVTRSAYQRFLYAHAGRRVELIVRPILEDDNAPDPAIPARDEPVRTARQLFAEGDTGE